MRALFIILVVLNLLVFASVWIFDAPASQAPSVGAGAPSAPQRLLLLQEIDRDSSLVPSSRGAVAEGAASEGGEMCTMVGPFGKLLHAEYFVDRMVAMDIDATIRSLEVPDGVGYWVYLAPEVSDAAALRRLYEVQSKKIDSYIIPSGDLARGISLGIYSDRAEADARMREIADHGYQPAVREVARAIGETWVSLPSGQGEAIDQRVWLEILGQYPGVEKRQNFCPGVAPQ